MPNSSFKNIRIALVYTVLSFLIAKLFFQFVFDDSYDAFLSNMSAFQFTDFSLFDQHYLGLIFIRDLLKLVQNTLPQINVFASAYLFFNVLSLFYLLFSLHQFYPIKHAVIKHFLSLLFAALFLENILSITHTRFATIFAGLALINLLYFAHNKKSYFFHFLVFLFGFFARPEGALGVVIIAAVSHFIFKANRSQSIKAFSLPILTILIFIISFNIDKASTQRFEIKIEPDIEYAISTNRILPISAMQNEADSLKHEMAQAAMFIDTSFVSVAFLRTLLTQQYSFESARLIRAIEDITYYYSYYCFFSLLFFVLLLMLIMERRYFSAIKFVFFQFFIFGLLCALDYNIAVADRHFMSVAMIVAICQILFVASFKHKLNGIYLAFFALSLLFGTGISVKNALGNQVLVAEEVACISDYMQKFESLYQDRKLIITHSSFHLLDKPYSFLRDSYTKNDYLLYDAVNYSIVPRNLEYLSKQCQCKAERPEEFLEWAAKQKAIFLLTEERASLMEDYMKLAHGQKLKFRLDENYANWKAPACLDNLIFENCKPFILDYDVN
ncbi:MAG: hypothetical protein H6579_05050 [Chitinophagales bacterium]|nr:hypothetical protein [Chitinophagales bacterium]